MHTLLFLLLTLFFFSFSLKSKTKRYHHTLPQDTKPDLITGHIISHSHCDPGWLETFEGYFLRDVNSIITGVVNELLRDGQKRFVWAEISFFSRWYEHQSIETKKSLKVLVEKGQWEFVGGGWVQNDEANPSIYGVINQMTVGHEYLLKNFGVQPRIAWQIDPFGHSATTPTIFALMGFEALVINRIHFAEKDHLKSKVEMEFIWRGSNVGVNTDMMTHVLHTHYSAPKSFDFEEGGIPINDQNIQERSSTLCTEIKFRAKSYRSNNVLIPFGDDFKFKNPGVQYGNMDRLIKYMNSHPELGCSIRYSTLSEYFDAAHNVKASYPIYNSDFFPYADNGESFWTGFYTTRPFLKTIARKVDALLHSASLFMTFGLKVDDQFSLLEQARQNAGLFLHHDAITGTARAAVNIDYMSRMESSAESLTNILMDRVKVLTKSSKMFREFQGDESHVHITNPLGWPRSELISIKIKKQFCKVICNGNIVKSQVEHFVTEDSISSNDYLCSFIAELEGASVKACKITLESNHECTFVEPKLFASGMSIPYDFQKYPQFDGKATLKNTFFEAKFEDGLLRVLTDVKSSVSRNIAQKLNYYSTQKSGAYIFRPEGPAKDYVTDKKFFRLMDGPVVSTLYVSLNSFYIVFKLIHSKDMELSSVMQVKTSVVVGVGEEMITRFETSVKNSNIFFTDNGLDWIAREFVPGHPIASNYYPMVGGAKIQDLEGVFSVLTSHSAGCASQKESEIEIMLHRSMREDDGRGLAEAVVDTTRGELGLWLSLKGTSPDNDLTLRRMQIRLNYPVNTFFSSSSPENIEVKLLQKALPDHIHLLALSPRDFHSDDAFIRLQSLCDSKDSSYTASLSDYLKTPINSLREVSLSLNYELDVDEFPIKRFKYSYEKGEVISFSEVDYIKVKSVGGASQNTNEDGVFLSDSAMKRKLFSFDNSKISVNPLGLRSFMFVAEMEELKVNRPKVVIEVVKKTIPPPEVTIPPLASTISPSTNAPAIKKADAVIESTHAPVKEPEHNRNHEILISSIEDDISTHASTIHGLDTSYLLPSQSEFLFVILICLFGLLVLVASIVPARDYYFVKLPFNNRR